jgi:hypothetical protein
MNKFRLIYYMIWTNDKGDPCREGGRETKEKDTYAEAVDFVQRG